MHTLCAYHHNKNRTLVAAATFLSIFFFLPHRDAAILFSILRYTAAFLLFSSSFPPSLVLLFLPSSPSFYFRNYSSLSLLLLPSISEILFGSSAPLLDYKGFKVLEWRTVEKAPPNNIDFNLFKFSVKKESLEAWILREFTGSESDDDLILHARGFIFLLLGGHMLPDMSGSLIRVRSHIPVLHPQLDQHVHPDPLAPLGAMWCTSFDLSELPLVRVPILSFKKCSDMDLGEQIDDLIESGTIRLLDWNDSMTDIS
ncbi:hypothetical protein M9H77_27419 [Catharanthus roseus]|uniref:Uncharacterized protein n=1 Tax=Catharanthus roseus TaxID=4058 RepID=A0ACC0ADF7_CATRO|nr:hypothetical protein M9H77_27419 [Catharanthus roseus]